MSNQIISDSDFACGSCVDGVMVRISERKIRKLCSNSDRASYIHFHTNMNIKSNSMNPHPNVMV